MAYAQLPLGRVRVVTMIENNVVVIERSAFIIFFTVRIKQLQSHDILTADDSKVRTA